MPYNINLKVQWLIALALIPVLCMILLQSLGGIDIDRYWHQAWQIDFSNPYYIKEFASWKLIEIISLLSTRQSFLALLFIASILLIACFSSKLLPAFVIATVSPFGVLLFANVLRQGIACVFFSIAIKAYIDRKHWKALIFSLLSIASHNTFILFFIAIIFSITFNIVSKKHRFLFIAVASFCFFSALYILLNSLSVDREFSYIDDGIENYLYGFFAAIACLIWFKFSLGRERIIAGTLFLTMLLIYAFAYYFNFPGWVPGRFAASMSLVALIFVYSVIILQRWSVPIILVGILFSVIGIYIHRGASMMLFNN